MALWSGRFSADTDAQVAGFTASVQYDQRLYPFDIQGSVAHVNMLARAGIVPGADADAIVAELGRIKEKLDQGELALQPDLEDIHMNVEAALIEALGAAGARVHTGRSRNDQVATDERLYLRQEADAIRTALTGLQQALVNLARDNATAILPGLTHMQYAQPVLLAHHLLAYVEMLDRDRGRLADCRRRFNLLPLGAGALAGSSLPLDREGVARELGFDGVLRNSMDAVSDRDFIVEFLAALSVIAMHTSRLAEDLILWVSQPVGFLQLDDRFCTGSSLMPQKRNPDVAELVRGKTGRVYGALFGMLTVLKGLPLTYNRDLQEDKEGLFDAIDTVEAILGVMAALLTTAEFNVEAMAVAADTPALMATDLAEWLVRRGVPFRDAHHQVGKLVAHCEEQGVALNEVPLPAMRELVPEAREECLALFSARESVASRDLIGGTAPNQVAKQLQFWAEQLAAASA